MTLTKAVIAALDPGIKSLVIWLNGAGWEVMDVPNISIRVDPDVMISSSRTLMLQLKKLPGCTGHYKLPPGVQIQASYDPADGTAVLLLTGLDDKKAGLV
jgi:hypothetical protein